MNQEKAIPGFMLLYKGVTGHRPRAGATRYVGTVKKPLSRPRESSPYLPRIFFFLFVFFFFSFFRIRALAIG